MHKANFYWFLVETHLCSIAHNWKKGQQRHRIPHYRLAWNGRLVWSIQFMHPNNTMTINIAHQCVMPFLNYFLLFLQKWRSHPVNSERGVPNNFSFQNYSHSHSPKGGVPEFLEPTPAYGVIPQKCWYISQVSSENSLFHLFVSYVSSLCTFCFWQNCLTSPRSPHCVGFWTQPEVKIPVFDGKNTVKEKRFRICFSDD